MKMFNLYITTNLYQNSFNIALNTEPDNLIPTNVVIFTGINVISDLRLCLLSNKFEFIHVFVSAF